MICFIFVEFLHTKQLSRYSDLIFKGNDSYRVNSVVNMDFS